MLSFYPMERVAANYGHGHRPSFWSSKSEWLEVETTFNVDRVRTPLLAGIHGSSWVDISGLAAVAGAFRGVAKPFDMFAIPQGDHQLALPSQRLAEAEIVIQWFDFWLNDVLPRDVARASAWQRLREQQRANLRGQT